MNNVTSTFAYSRIQSAKEGDACLFGARVIGKLPCRNSPKLFFPVAHMNPIKTRIEVYSNNTQSLTQNTEGIQV